MASKSHLARKGALMTVRGNGLRALGGVWPQLQGAGNLGAKVGGSQSGPILGWRGCQEVLWARVLHLDVPAPPTHWSSPAAPGLHQQCLWLPLGTYARQRPQDHGQPWPTAPYINSECWHVVMVSGMRQ